MENIYTVERKWESHKTVPCQGQWLYRAECDAMYVTDWMIEKEYRAWKETTIIEDF